VAAVVDARAAAPAAGLRRLQTTAGNLERGGTRPPAHDLREVLEIVSSDLMHCVDGRTVLMPQGKEDSMANDEEPRKPRAISVTEDVYAIITREAKERGISRSALVREFAILISDRKAKKEIR
jgi:hypothetical protein